MVTRLLLIRHGHNQLDGHLDRWGCQETEKLVQHGLSGKEEIKALYACTSNRTRETADIIAQGLGISEVKIAEGINENTLNYKEVARAIGLLVKENPDKTIALVTHEFIISMVVEYFCKIPDGDFPYTSLTTITSNDNEHWSAERIGDVSHLNTKVAEREEKRGKEPRGEDELPFSL